MTKVKETELAKLFIDSFHNTDYEVFQEVQFLQYDNIVDIVLKHNKMLWSVEVKTSLNMVVLGQALENKEHFHYSSVAVPFARRNDKGRQFAYEVASHFGIGIFLVSKYDIREIVKAKFNRKACYRKVNLVPEHKTYATAGNSDNKYWTPFQNTKRELINYVKRNPGSLLKDVMSYIGHHYVSISSACSSMRKWIDSGVISELRIEKGGKVFLKES